jgi:hypothetical protein
MHDNSMARRAAMDQRRTPSKHDRFTRHREYTQYRSIEISVLNRGPCFESLMKYDEILALRPMYAVPIENPSGDMGGLSSQL